MSATRVATTTGVAYLRSLPITSRNVGVKNGATVSVVEYGDGLIHQTVLTLTALPLTLLDASQGAGVKIYDWPEGNITVLGVIGSIAETTTSVLATTLHASVDYAWALGLDVQTGGSFNASQQLYLQTTTGSASATINVAGPTSTAGRTATIVPLSGAGTPLPCYFNVGVPTAGDIDGNATTTWTGTITLSWIFNGDT